MDGTQTAKTLRQYSIRVESCEGVIYWLGMADRTGGRMLMYSSCIETFRESYRASDPDLCRTRCSRVLWDQTPSPRRGMRNRVHPNPMGSIRELLDFASTLRKDLVNPEGELDRWCPTVQV